MLPPERAVEMREELPAARRLPAQVAQTFGLHRQKPQPFGPAKCFAAVSAACAAVEKWM
jgi:hypothetical protein